MSSTTPRRAALVFVFIAVALDMLALGLVVPVLPKLVVELGGGDTASGAQMYGVFGTTWALMQWIASPVLGALSDRFGRRPVILLSALGLGLDYILMALAPTIAWLFVGRLISGITAASYSTASAYIADITPPEKRAAGFGMLGAAFGLGFVLGPAIGGVLGGFDARLPFWVAGGLSLLNALYGLFVLPESLPKALRAPFSLRDANPFGSLALLSSHPQLLGLAIVAFMGFVAHDVLPSTFVLYASHRYQWNEATVGLTLAAIGVCSTVVQALLIGPLVQRMGERNALLFGLSCGAAAFVVFGFAPSGGLFALGIPLMALWGLAGAASQGLMTQRVAMTQQGALQGATSSLRSVAGLIGPGLFTFTFARFIAIDAPLSLPGAPFVLASVLLAASIPIALWVTRSARAALGATR
jgi:DHA1 family tetracycline resistance protein-like MFS transporter